MTPSDNFPSFQGDWARCPLCEGAGVVLEERCCGQWGEWGCCGARVDLRALCHWCAGEGRLPLPVARELALSSGNPAFFARIEAEALAAELIESKPALGRFSRDGQSARPQAACARRL